MIDETKRIARQNETIISLLGRIAFTEDEIRAIITSKKKTPEEYLKGYNSCDGEHSVSEIASIIGVTKGTLSPILADWETAGIIYEIDRPKGKFYKKLFPV